MEFKHCQKLVQLYWNRERYIAIVQLIGCKVGLRSGKRQPSFPFLHSVINVKCYITMDKT